MNEVKVAIGGREYAVACEEGQEDHLAHLASLVDGKLKSMMGDNLSPNESQNLLFGALFVADELHENRMSADNFKHTLEEELDSLRKTAREGSLALGQRDELKQTVSRLEEELDGLQSAQQRHSAEVDDIRAELHTRREESFEARKEQEKLASQLDQANREQEELARQLEQAYAELDEFKNAASSAPAAPAHSYNADDPELAPALERFADLLENCAEKLEGQLAGS